MYIFYSSLWVCGAGGIQNTIEEYAKKDKRIKYLGYLPKEEITVLQSKCDVLINPRQEKGAFTKYSFPSKTMEYLLSGSKVLMYNLPGIPEEYYSYISVIKGDTVEDLKNAILKACEDTDFYKSKYKQQVDWISSSKQAESQVEKIKEIIKID